jgi:CheY-like chemotaxis protein
MTSSALVSAAEVLLVEDDPGDVLMTREAFEQHHLGLQLHVVGDGEEALRFLRRLAGELGAVVGGGPCRAVGDLGVPGLEAGPLGDHRVLGVAGRG